MRGNIEFIAKHYGKRHQTIKAVEELGELTQVLAEAITKKPDTKHICEECADVWIMIQQMLNLYEITDNDFWEMCTAKINRQVERIKRNG